MSNHIDIGDGEGVPINNWRVGPSEDLPADEEGNEGDVYFTTDAGGDWVHDGSEWYEMSSGGVEGQYETLHTESVDSKEFLEDGEPLDLDAGLPIEGDNGLTLDEDEDGRLTVATDGE